MPIKSVNRDMAKSIDYYVQKGLANWGNSRLGKYNGVDLSYAGKRTEFYQNKKQNKKSTVEKNIEFISKYLTKYIVKQNQSWKFLPQHYSRSISNLATGYCLDLEECEIFENNVLGSIDVKKYITNDFCDIIVPQNGLSEGLILPLLFYNQKLFDEYENSKKSA